MSMEIQLSERSQPSSPIPQQQEVQNETRIAEIPLPPQQTDISTPADQSEIAVTSPPPRPQQADSPTEDEPEVVVANPPPPPEQPENPVPAVLQMPPPDQQQPQNQAAAPVQNFMQALRNFYQRVEYLVHMIKVILIGVFFVMTILMLSPQRHGHILEKCLKDPDVVVATDGSGSYSNISTAIENAPDLSNNTYCIKVKAEVYRENIEILSNKTNIAIVGEEMERTIVVSGSNATAAVFGPGFIAAYISFYNPGGDLKQDGVALYDNSSRAAFYKCTFVAQQSTIHFSGVKERFFRDCEIYGADKVISGEAAVQFQNCSIYVAQLGEQKYSVATSQQRSKPWLPTGFIFYRCRILPAPGRSPALNSTYLGSPAGNFSRLVFIRCFLSSIVSSAGWISEGDFSVKTIYFAEFGNTGPGADTVKRIHWPGYKILDLKGAAKYSLGSFFGESRWIYSIGGALLGGFPVRDHFILSAGATHIPICVIVSLHGKA